MNYIGPHLEWELKDSDAYNNWALYVKFVPNGDGMQHVVETWLNEPTDTMVRTAKRIAIRSFLIFGKNVKIPAHGFNLACELNDEY